MDVALFGLVYYVVFEEKNIDFDKKDEISKEIANCVGNYKNEYLHKKNPSAFKYLRERVSKSIGIYRKYVK